MKNRLLPFSYLFFVGISGLAQNFSGPLPGQQLTGELIFENLNYEDGLPDRVVWGLEQDRQGFMWFATKNGLVRYDGLNFKIYQHLPGNSTSLSTSKVWEVEEDQDGILWIATYNGRLNYFDPQTEKFSVFPLMSHSGQPLTAAIWNIKVDRQNRIWVGTRGRGLYIIHSGRDSVSQFLHDPNDPESLSNNFITACFEDSHGRHWVPTTGNGLNLFDPETGRSRRFLHQAGQPSSLASNFGLLEVVEDGQEKLWVSTGAGLSVLDMRDTSFTNYYHEPDNPNSLSHPALLGLTVDAGDRIWTASHIGLNLYDPGAGSFSRFFYNPFNAHSPTNDFSHALLKDRTDNIWITTSDGISKYSLRPFTFISLIKTLEEKKTTSFDSGIRDILEDRSGNIWIATHVDGLYVYEPATGTVRHYYARGEGPFQMPFVYVWELEEDRNGRILIGGGNGLFYYHRERQQFEYFCDFRSQDCSGIRGLDDFAVDRNGYVWIASGGLLKWDPAYKKVIEQYILQADNPGGLAIPLLMSIELDDFGNLWLAGEGGGLQCFNPATKTFSRPALPAGLSNNLAAEHRPIYIIDSRGRLWISDGNRLIRFKPDQDGRVTELKEWTTKGGMIREDRAGRFWLVRPDGITAFDPEKGEQEHYSLKGISESLDGSFCSTQSGGILLGGYGGLYHFDPEQEIIKRPPPALAFTDFKLFNRSVPVKGTSGDTLEWPSVLEQSIRFTRQIQLPHSWNYFTIEFVALDFHQPTLNQYKYYLEGDPGDTIRTTAERPFATYTNLSPGNYTFRLWGSNSEDVWNEEGISLSIIILPPWYWAWWSKLLYLLLIVGVIYTLYHFQLKRRLALAESQRLEELDAFKTRLYTNLTHEFRTPLTVISGMADQVLEHPKEWFREGLAMIKRNSAQLLRLVNQMLDLSKLESGSLPVHLVQDDIIRYLKYLTESFHSYAETKDIRLHLLPEVEELYMDFDPEKIRTIFSNLVGNAIKYTPAGGDVYITVNGRRWIADGDPLVLKVRDNGIGIPAAQLPFIFDQFYQVDDSHTRRGEGTGIGLTLTKELVELLGGSIEVSSREREGTEFSVLLPIRQEAERKAATVDSPDRELLNHPAPDQATALPLPAVAGADAELPLALLIENNRDVLRYLAASLQGRYQLEMAVDGKEGIEKAVDLIPDIIISDVMMPEKDGFEVLATLKQDERTSHIPVVLLTAKADIKSRLEGLERGADAYLAKPFEQRELEVVLRKLIELRQQWQARYGALLPAADAKDMVPAPEDAFLSRLRQCIEQHLEEEDFGIHELCRALGVSRTQLHRKLKAVTGKSTSQVIRSIRMQKAMELLKDSNLNVSEVGYAVGYSNRSHFTQEFTKEFGVPPSFYRNKE